MASVPGCEADDNACRLGLVRRQLRQRLIAPIGQIDDHADGRFRLGSLGRFQHIERRLKEVGKDIQSSTLEEMDRLWEEAKRE